MKKILLTVDYIGKDGFEETDKKVVDFIKNQSDDTEICIKCKDFLLNKAGMYINAKSNIKIFTEFSENLNDEDFDDVVNFDKNSVVSQINKTESKIKVNRKISYDITIGKIADIVIPHHDRHDHLKDCLDLLPNDIFNIIIVSGKSFSENCNKGASLAETENIIFLNDDTVPNVDYLIEMCENKADFMGASQIIPNENNEVFHGIRFLTDEGIFKPRLTKNIEEVVIPTGFLLRVKKSAWEKLGGFDEKFINGGEDTDLALRAMELGMTFDYQTKPIVHKQAQSNQRFIAVEKNAKYLDEKWPESKILNLINKKSVDKTVLIATNHLSGIGGTETWTYAMAKEFERIGYKVDVFSFNGGEISEKLNMVEEPKEEYELVLINHKTCWEKLKNVKGKKIFTSHGKYIELEQPEKGADKYVAISEEIKKHLKENGFDSNLIRNGIDCRRFKPKNKINKKLKRVLCMCQGIDARNNVKKACEELGLEYDDTSERIFNVEEKINKADLVITLGRGAYESMACGREVIIYDTRPYSPHKTADGIITKDNFKKLMKNNFSGRTEKFDWKVSDIKKEFKKYNQSRGSENRKIAVNYFNVNKQVKKYINL